jgi:hypothetical protein
LVASRVYRAIGIKLRAQDSVFWEGRIMVSDRRKVGITVGALIGASGQGFFWRKPFGHDASLHAALLGLPYIEPSHAIR